MSVPRRNHYIPQFYLKNFTINNLLYEYDKANNNTECRSPRGVGWHPSFNIFIDYHLRKNAGLENFLNFAEDRAAVAIQKIIKNDALSDPEMVDFIFFLSMMNFRVPKFKKYVRENFLEKEKNDFFEEFNSIEKRKEFIQDFNNKTKKQTDITADNFFEKVYVSDEAFEDGVFFYYMLKSAFDNVKEFINKDWYFIETKNDNFFITSDDPLATLKEAAYRLKVLEIIKRDNSTNLYIFPISKNLVLFLFKNDLNKEPAIKGRFKLDETEAVIEINRMILQECFNFIYSPNLNTVKNSI